MELEVIEGIELDICYSCGGTWYDRGELEQHLAKAAEQPDEAGADSGTPPADWQRTETIYLKCPKCDRPMNRVNFGRRSGIIVDMCGPHGVFLDAGEFEGIKDYQGSAKARLARHDDQRARESRERQKKRDEARRRQRDLVQRRSRGFGFWR